MEKRNQPDINETPAGLEACWKPAAFIAKDLVRSRPWVYRVAKEHNLRSVSLATEGKVGSRFFDYNQLKRIMIGLAEAQAGKPFPNRRRPEKGSLKELN
jgi:hypothetical protein